MLKRIINKSRNAMFLLAGVLVLAFALPTNSYAYASNGLPESAKKLMVGVFIASGIILAVFVFAVYMTGRKNRRP